MLPMAALTALVVRSEPFTLPTFRSGVLFMDRFVMTNVLSCTYSGCQCESRPPLRPVLKHGPRSVTCTRVKGWKTLRRNESKGRLTD